ncbi:MAG: hypothetical protein HON90_11535 [Halobacteriovoraceae bacterium]|jgi:hypothetical protein|nr:hypothetical protein [Halobacteriovoraceae bacterium]
MKYILLSFIFFSSSIMASTQFSSELLELAQDLESTGVMQEREDQVKYLKFYHGPIVQGAGYKYGIEYLAEAFGSVDTNNKFILNYVEISIMSLPYCDFEYAQAQGYRFQRTGMIYDSLGQATQEVQFTRSFPSETNDGFCSMADDESTTSENIGTATEPAKVRFLDLIKKVML